jgi:tripartite-type tricarboxylate transporter receptor subunit TctC
MSNQYGLNLLRTLLLSLFCISFYASAQNNFPDKPLHIIVPQPPGGGFDYVGRVLADKMGPLMKESMIVENRPGVGTVVGTDYVAKLPPDGYTAVVGSISNIVMNPWLYKSLPYDPMKDFVPVGLATSYSYTLVGRQGLPFNDLKGLIQYAKNNPGKLTYASGGNGTGQHVLAAALWNKASVDIVHVPYKGAQAAYTDIIGGRVDLFFDLSPTVKPHIDAGSVVPYATSGATRNPNLPNVPTIIETGVSNIQLESWFGLFVPAKTPPEILAKWQDALQKVANMPDVKERFEKAGGRPISPTIAEVKALVQTDYNRWKQLISNANIKAD